MPARRKPSPQFRGTSISRDNQHALLYTLGSVDFYRAYPSPRVPRPLEVQFNNTERSLTYLQSEILPHYCHGKNNRPK